MQFFDQKEEVIDIQLTQHGKMLLCRGKLKPAYYAFFDNDIMYDASYANREETQNSIDDRIRKNTPRLKSQYMFQEAKTTTQQMELNPIAPEHNYSLGMCLGDSSLGSQNAPAWSVDYLYGELSSSIDYMTGSAIGTSSIPQLESTVNLEIYVTEVDVNGGVTKNYIPEELEDVSAVAFSANFDEIVDPDEGLGIEADDGTILQIKPDFLLLEISEENTEFLTDNFEIEVFEVESVNDDNGRPKNVEKLLEFYDFNNTEEELGPQHVEYHFEITSDKEIPAELFCASNVLNEKKRSKFADNILPYPVNCPEFRNAKNIYIEDVLDVEEPC